MILFYSLAYKYNLNKDYSRAMFEHSISTLTTKLISKPQKNTILKTIKHQIKQRF